MGDRRRSGWMLAPSAGAAGKRYRRITKREHFATPWWTQTLACAVPGAPICVTKDWGIDCLELHNDMKINNGKGSRPRSGYNQTYRRNFDSIFRKRKPFPRKSPAYRAARTRYLNRKFGRKAPVTVNNDGTWTFKR
jgi:hypothetical protein